jgi:AsmA protein
MDKIEGSFDIGDPRMPMKQIKMPVSGALHADLARQSADGGLATQIDDTKISLKFGATKFSPLALNFDLGADKLNLDKYFPPQPAGEKAEPKSAGTAAAGEDKIDFSALKTLTLNGAIRVGQLQAHNVKVGDLRIPLHIAAGRLDAAPLTANLYEGTLNGAFSADAADNAVAIRQNLSGIRIGTLLKDAANKDVLDGRGNVALNVAAHGKTLGEMKKALAGTASLSLKDGAIKGIDLAQSFRDLKGKFGAKQDQTLASKAADKTDFSELAATFNIANGVAHNDDLAAKSPFLRLAGSGDIDIGASRLNYLLKASIVATSGGQGAKELENLKGITVPVRLTGPFDSPSWQIEFAGMAGAAAQAAIDQTKQKAQDKVKDKLKGLFGR